jgi:hypothetical protein
VPLLRLATMPAARINHQAAAPLSSAELDDPYGYAALRDEGAA